MEPLTERQQALFDWIIGYIKDYGHSPSYRQMTVAMGLSSPAPIQARIEHLIKKGYLERSNGKARTLRPVQRERGLTIQGTIAAGGLVETFPEAEPFDFSHLLSDPQIFALRVQGDSMIEALIDHNDVVLLRPPRDMQTLKDGTIVAARVEHQTTLKHFYRRGRQVTLKPANPNYEPMLVDAKTIEIQGVLVGVLRSFTGL